MVKKLFLLFSVVLIFLFVAAPVWAEEVINDYTVTISINEDASIDVVEKITYDFGLEQKHGIFRDIPYKYKARGGTFKLRYEDFGVADSGGNAYNFEVLNKGDHKSIKIGDADKTVTGANTYVISYKVKRAINYFNDHDELYWNVTGNEWKAPIKQSKATVKLLGTVNEVDLKTECFAGPMGGIEECVSSRYDYSSQDKVGSIVFINDKLNSWEGMTVVVGWPIGIVKKPSTIEMITDFLKDNGIMGLPLLAGLIMYMLWRRFGRDPEGRGTIIAQFEAPDNLSPSEVGTIIDETADRKDISADIINLAVKGYLKIERLEKGGLLKSTDYRLLKLRESGDLGNEHEKKLFKALFAEDAKEVKLSELKNSFYKDLIEIKKEVYNSTVNKKYFPTHPNKIRGIYIAAGIALIAFGWLTIPMFGIAGIFSVALSGVIVAIFGYFMPQKTKVGAMAREHILGLKEYLRVAEKDRIKFHNAPEKNPAVFEKLLPFAMVLGVEKEWAKQFEGLYNASPSWYSDPTNARFSALALTNSLNGFESKANTTLASRPSSASSGGSGFSGGSSGGGFGGGGGGSW